MRLYRAVISPVVSFASPLQSDTLFGAFCWSYRYCYGEDKLKELLLETRQGNPSVIFSNAFPKGTLPLPMGVRDNSADFERIEKKEERQRAYQRHKKLKNARYVEKSWFRKIQEGENNGFTAGLAEDEIRELTVPHNLVSRQDGVVKNLDGSGSLFEEDEYFGIPGHEYDVYILSSFSEAVLKPLVQMMFLLGIGKNKSTGKGSFELNGWHEEQELFNCPKANAYMALSNFIPAPSDPAEGWYKPLVKFGKLDREYAMSETPFKKPLLFFQAGAVFRTEQVNLYYGSCMENVSVVDGVVVNAYTIAVPVHLNL